MCFASLFTAFKYGHAEHSFEYPQFDALEGGLIVPFTASLMEKASIVGLARVLTLCDFYSVLSSLAIKRSTEIVWGTTLALICFFLVINFRQRLFLAMSPRERKKAEDGPGGFVKSFSSRFGLVAGNLVSVLQEL